MNILLETRAHLDSLDQTHRVFWMKFQDEGDRQCEVDWECIKEVKYNKQNVISMQKQAKKLSLKPEIYSVHIVAYEENDPIFQEFWENGNCTRMYPL